MNRICYLNVYIDKSQDSGILGIGVHWWQKIVPFYVTLSTIPQFPEVYKKGLGLAVLRIQTTSVPLNPSAVLCHYKFPIILRS